MKIAAGLHEDHGPPRGGTRPDTRMRIQHLTELAVRGLTSMYDGDGFPQTARGIKTSSGTGLRLEGRSTRYTSIAALGLHLLPDDVQRNVLRGGTAAELADRSAVRARDDRDTGAVALAVWACAEITGSVDPALYEELRRRCESGTPLSTVDTAWALTAALAARNQFDSTDLTTTLTERLLGAQGPGGLFPHMIPLGTGSTLRRHVGSFADQVYPIQALARRAAATNDEVALAAANAGAARICTLQGAAGQWWWHYDARGDAVVERFPVYSVHQHAMAPLVLFDLAAAGGDDHTAAVELGVDWLYRHPETLAELVCESQDVVWRKVGRREPRKAARSIAATATALRPGSGLPALDRLFPAGVVDYECRPYELGWMLYAWLPRNVSGGLDDQQRRN
ncbi:hypothetical protein [Rhodococcus sp. NPDC047139]|uniref:hypothetical protein n=1 Tax=Rhodococcus sp. NPDC047139 TaxID=3155141 RepID=UPI003400394B